MAIELCQAWSAVGEPSLPFWFRETSRAVQAVYSRRLLSCVNDVQFSLTNVIIFLTGRIFISYSVDGA